MDVWIIVNPILRVFLYAASFLSVGTLIFSLHFSKHLTVAQQSYCDHLAFKTALVGSVVSLLMFFFFCCWKSRGDVASFIEPLMLQLALESKPGVGVLTAFIGFMVMSMAHGLRGYTNRFGLVVGSAALLLSFTISGHSQLGGFSHSYF